MLRHFLKYTNLMVIVLKILLFLIFLRVFSNLQAILPRLKLQLTWNIFFNLSAISFVLASSMNTAKTASIISKALLIEKIVRT